MNDERLRVLKLLEEKKISADEAARLLDAVGRADGEGDHRNRFLKVRVWERNSEKPKVNVTLPISLVKWGMKMAPEHAKAKIADADIDLKVVADALESGVTGKIVEVDDDDGDHVEVWLE
ncbi:MAG TPA: hypothetical protein ENN51_06725 [candidate division WOR-3 bacterium]|uniref:YvlB/LiaX N-terminal domain-containing protein n=1 Tax=candidate division WOR-3 bacterium TaxID=2052148 RepID=A0A7V0T695_UNCW3|nr:hypothetical protein [candidate division WOR-3 bacterium]